MAEISIVIPVRDGEAHIAEALQSALSQGPAIAEIVVVDDGSRDGTARIVQGFYDSRIRLVEGEARGVSAARNLGLALAKGKWVMFLDADDRLRPGAIGLLLETASTGQPVAIYGDYERIDGAGNTVGRRALVRARRAKPSGAILENLLGGNFIVNGGIMLIDRAAFARLGGFDEALRYCEDWHAWCRLAATGDIVYRPGAHILDYRVHGASTMMARAHTMADYRPALDAMFADPAIRARIPSERLVALKARASAHLNAYLLGQAARARRYGALVSGLFATLMRDPIGLPRTLAVCGAAIAGV